MVVDIVNLSKTFKLPSGEEKMALNNVNLRLDSALICVLGKSGSGKSTLLNLIGLLDKPTSGKVLIEGKDINKLNSKEKIIFRKKTVSYVFQHYHLIEDQTGLFNVMLPLLLSGKSYSKSKSEAIKLLQKFDINENQYNKKASLLSGGEKQRIAIARAVINNPKIILADEPTGALDSNNGELVMEAFKNISKDHLVIVVTHNEELADKYANTLIRLEDGNINYIEERTPPNPNVKNKHGLYFHYPGVWQKKLIITNLFKRLPRHVITIASLVIAIVSTLLIVGFAYGSENAINSESLRQFDLGVGKVSNEVSESIADTSISLVRTSRPTLYQMLDIRQKNHKYIFCLDYDGVLSNYTLSIGESLLNELSYSPVYSFKTPFVDESLLIEGILPKDNLTQVVINKSAYDYLKKKTSTDPIDKVLDIKINNRFTYYTGDQVNPYINDYFIFERKIVVKGVVDELHFLSTPKVYYPYIEMEEYMENTLLINLSNYLGEEINWNKRLVNASDNDPLTNYSYKTFLKDINDFGNEDFNVGTVYFTNNSSTIIKTLKELISASSVGMSFFLVIAVIGSVLILGILSFSSYSEDRKVCAILSCLGAKKQEITDIYVCENLLIGLVSVSLSLLLSYFLVKPINLLLHMFTGLRDIVFIPFRNLFNVNYLLPLLIFISVILITYLGTIIPINMSKKISLKEELDDE